MLRTVRSFWGAAFKPFFLNTRLKYRLIAYVSTFIMIALTIANVWGAVQLSYEVNKLGVAIQTGAAPEEFHQIVVWIVGIMVLFVATDPAVNGIILPCFSWYWQEALMTWYLGLWDKRTSTVDDAAQRIKDCSKVIAETIAAMCIRSFRCLVGFVAFAPVLWQLSENFQFILPIPGLLLWFMIFVCSLETVVSWYFGRKLPELEKRRQRADAALRSALEREQHRRDGANPAPVDLSTHGHDVYSLIKLLRKATFAPIFASIPLMLWQQVYGNFWGYGLQLTLGWFVAVLKIFPYGIMWQTISVVGEIHRSLSIFADSWQTITMLQATVERIEEIEEIIKT